MTVWGEILAEQGEFKHLWHGRRRGGCVDHLRLGFGVRLHGGNHQIRRDGGQQSLVIPLRKTWIK